MMTELSTLGGIGCTLPGVPALTHMLFAEIPREIVEPYDIATPPIAARVNLLPGKDETRDDYRNGQMV